METRDRANRHAFGEAAQPTIIGHNDCHHRTPRESHRPVSGRENGAGWIAWRLERLAPEIKHETWQRYRPDDSQPENRDAANSGKYWRFSEHFGDSIGEGYEAIDIENRQGNDADIKHE
jgi:hypothetical protein